MGHISYFQNTILPMNISIASLFFSFILKSNFRNSPSLSLSYSACLCLNLHQATASTSWVSALSATNLRFKRVTPKNFMLFVSLPLLLNKLRPSNKFRSSFLFVSFFIIQLVNLLSNLSTLFLKILDISFFFINITNMAKYIICGYKKILCLFSLSFAWYTFSLSQPIIKRPKRPTKALSIAVSSLDGLINIVFRKFCKYTVANWIIVEIIIFW